ncbi:girdin-like isoform X2 [Dysidea avara]
MNKAEQYMESPLVAWVMTFDDFPTVNTVTDLADGILLNEVMHAVDPETYTMSKVNRTIDDDLQLRLQNLQLLLQRILHFYENSLQFLVITPLPNVTVISQEPEGDYSLDEMEKLMMLLLGCVVMCEGKGPLIEKMKGMELTQQHALVAHIQQITDTTEYVCSVDWTELEDLPKSNVEALCRQVYLYLQRVAKERDRHYEAVIELTQERDFFKAQQMSAMSADGSTSEVASTRSSLLYSPLIQGPSLSQELMETKGKLRMLQDQVDRKNEIIAETKDELEQVRNNAHKLQQEKRTLMEEARCARSYRDEVEALRVRATRCDRLENDVLKYKQKIEDMEYLKKKIADLKQQNELMAETKLLLEEKVHSVEKKLLDFDDMCVDNAAFKVQLDSVNEEKKMDQKRVEDILAQNAQLELEGQSLQDRVTLLTLQLEEERGRNSEMVNTSVETSLSVEMSEADMVAKAKLLRLEKETREMEKNVESLRHTQAKLTELEKTNKRLYEQGHEDKKEVIKLKEEVEILKVKASRVDKLQNELTNQKERMEEVSKLQARLKVLKQSKEAAIEAKAMLEDELQSLKHKALLLSVVQEENASLKAQTETYTTQHEEDQKLTDSLIAKNAQLELDVQRSAEQIASLTADLEQKRSYNPVASVPTIVSPPRVSESEMAAKAKLQRLEKETKEMEKSLESLRHSQAKLAELERINKKLNTQSHEDKKEIFKLKEEYETAVSKANKYDKLKESTKEFEQKLEESEGTIEELKQQHALLMDSKTALEEKLSSQQEIEDNLKILTNTNAELMATIERLEEEKDEEIQRVQELMMESAKIQLAKERIEVDMQVLNEQLDKSQQHEPRSSGEGREAVPPTPNGAPIPPPRSPDNILTRSEMAVKAKLLRLESYNRELENMDVFNKSNGSPGPEETDSSNKSKRASVVLLDRKDASKLRDELKAERTHVSHLKSEMAKLREQLRKEREGSTSEEKQKQLESKRGEAFAQSLANKEDRIQVLEGRLEQVTTNSTKLMEELQSTRKQNEKLKQYAKNLGHNSLRRESSSSKYGGLSDSEVTKLKEKAKELTRVREKMRAVQEENNTILHEMMENKQLVLELEAQNNKLSDRVEMQEQLIRTLEEENKQLLQQTNKLLAQNQELLLKTLETKDQCLEEEKLYSDKLGELEQEKLRLAQQVQSHQRQVLEVEIEKLRRNQKKKGVLKRSLRRIKGRFKAGGTKVLENPESSGVTTTTSNSSISPSTSTRFSVLPDPLGSPHSSSSKNSDADMMGAVHNVEVSPKGRRNTYSSGNASLLHSDSVMTLEDFLMESNKTPKSRRKYVEMHSAMATYSGSGPEPVVNKRQSDSFQPRSDNIEMPRFLQRSSPILSLESDGSLKGGMYSQWSQLSQTDSEASHSSSLKRSNYSLGHTELNLNSNGNNNNNNSNSGSPSLSDGVSPPLPPRMSTSPGYNRKSYLTHQQAKPNLKQRRSDSSIPIIKRYMPVKMTDGPSVSSAQKSMSLPKSRSSDELSNESSGKLHRKKSSSMEILDADASPVVFRADNNRAAGKPPLANKKKVPMRHRYSAPLLDISTASQKSDDSFWFEYGCV